MSDARVFQFPEAPYRARRSVTRLFPGTVHQLKIPPEPTDLEREFGITPEAFVRHCDLLRQGFDVPPGDAA